MSELDINRKEYPVGSVVYYIKKHGYKWEVSYGTVEENYVDTICIQLYEPLDTRCIDGIPIKEFKTPTRWQKLPKGWNYDTKLFEITHTIISYDKRYDSITVAHQFPDLSVLNSDDIQKLISLGALVKVQENDHAAFEDEVDKNKGWRIVRRYRFQFNPPWYANVRFNQVYDSYLEAQKVVDAHEAELKRQSELSDYDWSVEQIDRELSLWAGLHGISEEEKQKYRSWILKLDRVEDVEVRNHSGRIQWKYWKNKKWMDIEL